MLENAAGFDLPGSGVAVLPGQANQEALRFTRAAGARAVRVTVLSVFRAALACHACLQLRCRPSTNGAFIDGAENAIILTRRALTEFVGTRVRAVRVDSDHDIKPTIAHVKGKPVSTRPNRYPLVVLSGNVESTTTFRVVIRPIGGRVDV